MKPITEQDIASAPFHLQRLGVVMELEPGNPMEVEGVLNPATASAWRGWTCQHICRLRHNRKRRPATT